jgi:hypothetical protein
VLVSHRPFVSPTAVRKHSAEDKILLLKFGSLCQVTYIRPFRISCRHNRLLDLTKRLRPIPGKAYCVAGKVNSVHTLYLVVESIKLDSKHQQSSMAPPHDDGAEG